MYEGRFVTLVVGLLVLFLLINRVSFFFPDSAFADAPLYTYRLVGHLLVLLLFIILIPFVFPGSALANEMTELQRRYHQNFFTALAIACSPLLILLLLFWYLPIVPIGVVETFIISIMPVPLAVTFLCYHRWKHSGGPHDFSTASLAIVLGALFTLNVLVSAWVYHIHVETENKKQEHQKLQERSTFTVLYSATDSV